MNALTRLLRLPLLYNRIAAARSIHSPTPPFPLHFDTRTAPSRLQLILPAANFSTTSSPSSSSTPKLLCFRSLWGCELKTLDYTLLFPELKRLGYHGLECNFSDLQLLADKKHVTVQHVLDALSEHGFELIITAYSKWIDYARWDNASVDEQLRTLESQYKAIAALPFKLRMINTHAGSDTFSEAEHSRFFAGALPLTQIASCPVAFETHRGRSLHHPYVALRLAREFPQLRLTGDISHWAVVLERLMTNKSEDAILTELLPRFIHLHTRVGYAQHAQVPHTSMKEYSEEVKYFNHFWTRVFTERAKSSDVITLTPEVGPLPYTILGRDGKPIQDAWQYTNDELQRMKELYARWSENRPVDGKPVQRREGGVSYNY